MKRFVADSEVAAVASRIPSFGNIRNINEATAIQAILMAAGFDGTKEIGYARGSYKNHKGVWYFDDPAEIRGIGDVRWAHIPGLLTIDSEPEVLPPEYYSVT